MNRALPFILILLTAMSAAAAAQTEQAVGGAKGMFYEQLHRPTEKLNNGVQYWIELKRKGQTSRVSNKFAFQSGDQIRFHVKSNTDAFAYVVLREGSRGEKSVLFPDRRHADDNRMKANAEYPIPGDGFLVFDEFPGTEKVTLVLSRNAVEPNKFVPDSFRDKVIVASRLDGSKDLVPGSFVVAYGNASAPTSPAGPTSPAAPTSPATGTSTTGLASTPDLPPIPTAVSTPRIEDDSESIITIVQKNPSDALAVDICLEHKQ